MKMFDSSARHMESKSLGQSSALPVTTVLKFTRESTQSVECLPIVALILPPTAVPISSDPAAFPAESLGALYRFKVSPLFLTLISTVEDLRLQLILACSKSFAIKR